VQYAVPRRPLRLPRIRLFGRDVLYRTHFLILAPCAVVGLAGVMFCAMARSRGWMADSIVLPLWIVSGVLFVVGFWRLMLLYAHIVALALMALLPVAGCASLFVR